MCSLTGRTNAFLHVRRRRESDRKQTSEEEGLGRLLHLGTKLGTGSRTAAKLHMSGSMCGCSSKDGGGARAPGAAIAAKGSGKGGVVRRITFIVRVVPEMERMEIDKDLDALNKGKLQLPFHHEKDDGDGG